MSSRPQPPQNAAKPPAGATWPVSADRVKAVLFDKDGTLLDFQRSWGRLTERVLGDLSEGDFALRDKLADAAGYDFHRRRFRAHSPVVAGSAVDVVRAWDALLPDRSAADIVAYLNAAAAGVDPAALTPASEDLPTLLTRLRAAGLALGVATHDQEGAARRQLAQLGVAEMFDFIAGYDSGFAPKPGPEMLLGFARAVGVAPGAVVMVGDSLHDLGMGAAAGALARVGVLTGVAAAEDLAPHADVVLPSIDALPDYLGLSS